MRLDQLGSTLWILCNVASWSVYVGGAVVMEFVWRPAQEHLPMSQIGVACRRMGRRYRWVACFALVGAGTSDIAIVAVTGNGGAAFDATSSYGRTTIALALCWVALVITLSTLTFVAHPGLHVRSSTEMTEAERAESRERVRLAIRRMDLVLRIDLAIALVSLFPAASLVGGGLM